MNKDIAELLLMRTEQRDQFEAECQRLRRERDETREALQWVSVLVASNKVNTVRAMYLALERILRPLWPDGPTAPMDFITAIQRNIQQAHCCHNASAQKVDGDVSLVCGDCGASAPLFGVMQRLLDGQPEEKWPHGPPLPPEASEPRTATEALCETYQTLREAGIVTMEPPAAACPVRPKPGRHVTVKAFDEHGEVVQSTCALVTGVTETWNGSEHIGVVDCRANGRAWTDIPYSNDGSRPIGHTTWCSDAREAEPAPVRGVQL